MRKLLLDAAEETLRVEGAEGFSVRSITARAAVNVASVTTAFGGRTSLIDELFVRLMEPINAEREVRYRDLERDRSVYQVVRAFIEPLAVVDRSDRSAVSALLHLLVADPEISTHAIDRLLRDPGVERFDALLADLLPSLPNASRADRVRLAIGTVLSVTARGSAPAFANPAQLESLLVFVSAGISAP